MYTPVFAGYIADHALVKLIKEQANGLEDWEEDHVVEIQVVSVLLHAWAEVEHDITYKTIKAEANFEERKILDSLNGFMISSEILLDQLHTKHTSRVKRMTTPFPTKWALAIFLDGFISRLLDDEEKRNSELKMLLDS